MSYLDSLFSKTLDPRAAAKLRALFEAERIERANRMRQAQARVLQLEEDLARVALLSRTLAELCLSKGLITKQELAEQLVAPQGGRRHEDLGEEPPRRRDADEPDVQGYRVHLRPFQTGPDVLPQPPVFDLNTVTTRLKTHCRGGQNGRLGSFQGGVTKS
jgi:hypothetical protein